MRLALKIFLLSFFLSFSLKSFAGNYVSIFKPAQKAKTLSEFQKDVQKDVLQFRSIMSNKDKNKDEVLEKEKTIELVKIVNQKSIDI